MSSQPPASALAGLAAPVDPAQVVNNNLSQAVQSAPELQGAPGTALDVATAGGNIQNTAQAVVVQGNRTVRAAAAANTQKSHGGGIMGFLGSVGHDVAHVTEDVLSAPIKAVNIPLSVAQHEFRYLHDVADRHGFMAALMEGLVMAGTFAAGAVFTGGVADVAEAGALAAAEGGLEAAGGEAAAGAAEGAGTLARAGQMFKTGAQVWRRGMPPAVASGFGLGHALYTDSWNRTANGSIDPKTGKPYQQTNIGDVIAGWTGLKGAAHWAISAPANAVFDLLADPVNAYASTVRAARNLEPGVTAGEQLLAKPATQVFGYRYRVEDLERIAASDTPEGHALRNTAEWVAQHNDDPAAINRAFPGMETLHDDKLNDAGQVVAKGLKSAQTGDDVLDVWRRLLTDSEMTHSTILPSMSLSKAGMGQVRQWMHDAKTDYLHPFAGAVRRPNRLVGSLSHVFYRVPAGTLDPATNEFKIEFDPVSMRGAREFQRFLGMGMGDTQADSIVNMMYRADIPTRRVIARNAQLLAALGHSGMEFGNDFHDMTEESWFKDSTERALKQVTNPRVRKALAERIDELKKSDDPALSGAYATTRAGAPPRPFVDPDTGKEMAAAVYDEQRAPMPIMNYTQLHRMGQMIHGGRMFTGTMDDFLMSAVTEPIFKRWILFSLGYPLHIAASETLMNFWRLGPGRYFRGLYYSTLGNARRIADRSPDEAKGLSAWVYKNLTDHDETKGVLGRVKRDLGRYLNAKKWAAGKTAEVAPDTEQAIRRTMMLGELTDWELVTKGVASHGTGVDDPVGAAQNGLRGLIDTQRRIRGQRYTYYGPESSEHLTDWRTHLNLLSRDPSAVSAANAIRRRYALGGTEEEAYRDAQKAAQRTIESLPAAKRADFIVSKLKQVGSPAHMTPEENWSHVVAEDVMAVTHRPEGRGVHDQLVDNIANGDRTPRPVLHKIPVTDRPLSIPGREMLDNPQGWFARVATLGYRKVMMPMVNKLARQPLFVGTYLDNFSKLDSAISRGLMTEEEAAVKAASMATVDTIKHVHNIQDRTVFDQLFRNWSPFFFAQEQAYRRMGRLLQEDPAAFRRYMLMLNQTHNMVGKMQDGNGNHYFAIPGAGFLDHLTIGALGLAGMPTASLNPTGFGGTLSAANVIFPFANGVRPDLSPVVTLSAQAMTNMFEEFGKTYSTFQPVTNAVAGTLNSIEGSQNMSESVLQQLVPNTAVYRAISAFTADDTSFNSAMMSTLQTLAYRQNVAVREWYANGQKGPYPSIIPPPNSSVQARQEFLAKLKSQTRALFMMRAVLGFVSPVSAEVTVNDFGMNQKLQDAINSSKSVSAGFQKFLLENPDADPFVVSKSTTTTGAPIPDTQAAVDWLQQNVWNPQSPLYNHPDAAMWFMPRPTNTTGDNAYSAQAYLEQVADGARQRRTPTEFLDALYAENGNQMYYNALAQHQAALKSGANKSAEYAKWDAYIQHLQATQPIWWSQFSSGQRQSNAINSINDLIAVQQAGLVPKTQQAQDVIGLLNDFQVYEQQYMQAGTSSNYSTAQKQVKDAWIAHVTQMAQQKPNLDSIISSVFKDALTWYNATA